MATQRIALVLQSVPFIQLLFHVAMISYKKASNLVKISVAHRTTEMASSYQITPKLNNALKATATNKSRDTIEYTQVHKSAKPPSSVKDQVDRSRNRRGGTGLRAGPRRVIDDESTGDDEDDEDEEEDSDDDTDENELAENRTDPSDESDNENEDDHDEEEEEDDDSEPLLGKWFEETLFPPDEETNNTILESRAPIEDKGNINISSKSNEPAGFISLASHIFIFLNKHILSNESQYVKKCISSGLKEPQMFVIADIVKDLDLQEYNNATVLQCFHSNESNLNCNVHRKDRLNNNGNRTSINQQALGSLYTEFSTTIATFSHNLLAYGVLTSKLQNSLLAHLSVSPWVENNSVTDSEGPYFAKQGNFEWPLRVNSRTLALLAQVLLLRQNAVNEESSGSRDTASGTLLPSVTRQTNTYIVIWEKVLSTLTKCIFEEKDKSHEDLNVEHAQLLLMLFHALGLMQKKQVLIFAGNCLIKVASIVKCGQSAGSKMQRRLRTDQVFHVSRLVLLFEYIMTHLYEPPKQLLDQVQSNIFKKQYNPPQAGASSTLNLKYHGFKTIEDNVSQYEGKMEMKSPSFFNLFALPAENSSDQQLQGEGFTTPNKLDGLACSFVLGTPDALQYGQLYQSLIDILQVVHQTCTTTKSEKLIAAATDRSVNTTYEDKVKTFKHLAAVQYCFSLTWRLLQSMPPSVEFLDHLVATKETPHKARTIVDDEQLDTCSMLHSLLILPRIEQKVYATWVKDCLVKQG